MKWQQKICWYVVKARGRSLQRTTTRALFIVFCVWCQTMALPPMHSASRFPASFRRQRPKLQPRLVWLSVRR
jgi:hypothetical protein